MTAPLYAASVPAFRHALLVLDGLLDKAAAFAESRGIDPAALLETRLYPDMHPLRRQFQMASDASKNPAARLAGQEPPKMPDEEMTIPELKERLAKTVAYLDSLAPEAFQGREEAEVQVPVGPGRTLLFKAQPYLQGFALPNFYFHVTTAYAILRSLGVPLGKRDYLGPMPTL